MFNIDGRENVPYIHHDVTNHTVRRRVNAAARRWLSWPAEGRKDTAGTIFSVIYDPSTSLTTQNQSHKVDEFPL